MEMPTIEELAKNIAEKALDEYLVNEHSLREWVEKILDYAYFTWIPCKERVPNSIGYYLVSTNKNDVTTAYYFADSTYWKECVVAWMPLPKHY